MLVETLAGGGGGDPETGHALTGVLVETLVPFSYLDRLIVTPSRAC